MRRGELLTRTIPAATFSDQVGRFAASLCEDSDKSGEARYMRDPQRAIEAQTENQLAEAIIEDELLAGYAG